MNLDLVLRISALLLQIATFVYWQMTARLAQKQKPRPPHLSFKASVIRLGGVSLGAIISLQLLGLPILPFQQTPLLQIFGFLLTIFGTTISFWARTTLGNNWAHAADYQILKNHDLINTGIYKYIRHPIYSGMFVSCIGAELVAGSYLFLIFLVLLSIIGYQQAKREEKILTEHFGDKYKEYMKKTKMFIPFIW